MPTKFETILYEEEQAVARITLNRPQVHNAFNARMLAELNQCWCELQQRRQEIRVVILTGQGKSFCAGADLQWLSRMIDCTYQENLADSQQVADCMYRLYSLPQPTIARVNGTAIGGAWGLICACDFVLAPETATFSLSAVKLGLVAACITPYVIKKIGENHCRALFLSGERITAARAYELGLLNQVLVPAELDQAVQSLVQRLLANGPAAMALAKELITQVVKQPLEQARATTVEAIARLRIGPEAQEGMRAFLEKREPCWRYQPARK